MYDSGENTESDEESTKFAMQSYPIRTITICMKTKWQFDMYMSFWNSSNGAIHFCCLRFGVQL